MDMTVASTRLFRPGENCAEVAQARRIALLVDGAAYFEAFVRAAERAERSILIVAWDFDSRMTLGIDSGGKPVGQLGEFLNGLVHARRHLRIRILDWDFPMIYGTDREIPPVYGLTWKPHRHIDFRYDDTHPLAGSHHQKIVVIDDRLAFSGGLDLTGKRWDTPEHRPDDPRRNALGEWYPPVHDVMIAVDGDAAAALAKVARARWKAATGQTLAPVKTLNDPWPAQMRVDFKDVGIGIACTAPPAGGTPGVQHVERLFVDMIAGARRYIYIENQYFTSRRIADALAARLAEPDGPEIALVTRKLSHGWLEEMTMHVLRARLVRELRDADRHARFSAWCPEIEGLPEGTCIDAHSKVMVVDDEWLRVGSANLSNRSMGVDTECDVTVEARDRPEMRRAIRAFRDRLLAEHLGVESKAVADEVERSGSMANAIGILGTPARGLAPLADPEWPDDVVNVAEITDPEKPISLEGIVRQLAPEPVPQRSPARLVFGLAVLAILALGAIWRYTPLADVVTPENAIAWAHGFANYWWAPLLVVVVYTPASLVMFPRPLITLAAVVAFGPWEGFALAMSGIVLSASAGYWAGRLFGRATVRRIAGPRINNLSRLLQQRGLLAMTLIRLVPVAPFQVVNAAAGALHVRFRHFLVGTMLGMLPGALAATILGDQILAAITDRARLNMWAIAGAALVLALVAIVAHRKFSAKPAEAR